MLPALLLAASFFSLPDYQRVGPSGEMLDGGSPSATVALKAARGGYVSFQLVAKDAASYDLAVRLPFPVDAFREWQHTLQKDMRRYPDALIPVALPYAAKAEHAANAFWIDVWIPRDAVPGVVRGEAVLTTNGARHNIPMEIDVVNAVIPPGLCGPKPKFRKPPTEPRHGGMFAKIGLQAVSAPM